MTVWVDRREREGVGAERAWRAALFNHVVLYLHILELEVGVYPYTVDTSCFGRLVPDANLPYRRAMCMHLPS